MHELDRLLNVKTQIKPQKKTSMQLCYVPDARSMDALKTTAADHSDV